MVTAGSILSLANHVVWTCVYTRGQQAKGLRLRSLRRMVLRLNLSTQHLKGKPVSYTGRFMWSREGKTAPFSKSIAPLCLSKGRSPVTVMLDTGWSFWILPCCLQVYLGIILLLIILLSALDAGLSCQSIHSDIYQFKEELHPQVNTLSDLQAMGKLSRLDVYYVNQYM